MVDPQMMQAVESAMEAGVDYFSAQRAAHIFRIEPKANASCWWQAPCAGRMVEDVAKPRAIEWSDARWSEFVGKLNAILRLYHREGLVFYLFLLVALLLLLALLDMDYQLLIMLLCVVLMVPYALLLALRCWMQKANRDVDAKVVALCAEYTDASVQVKFHFTPSMRVMTHAREDGGETPIRRSVTVTALTAPAATGAGCAGSAPMVMASIVPVQQSVAPAAPAAVPAPPNPVEAIGQLKTLLDSGLITPEEFEVKKAEVLSRI